MNSFIPIRITIILLLAIHLLPLQATAQGAPKFDKITTTKDRTYYSVTVREITPSSIKILHDSGTATIPYKELPAEIQATLGGFDPAAAEQHRAAEDTKIKQTETAFAQEQRQALAAAQAAAQAQAAKAQVRNQQPAPPVIPIPSDPLAGGFPLPGGAIAGGIPFDTGFTPPGDATPPVPAAPPAPAGGSAAPAAKEKGILSVRIVGYRSGCKRIEIKATTNCPAEVQVSAALELPNTFSVSPGVPFTREIWVYNSYGVTLQNNKGLQLDYEAWNKKTDTFQRATLNAGTLHSPLK